MGLKPMPTPSPTPVTRPPPASAPTLESALLDALPPLPKTTQLQTQPTPEPAPAPIVSSLLNPIQHRTALVKLQGPFTDRQLESIARGMVYLQKLGLVSVIVVDRDDWVRGGENERKIANEETMRVTSFLEKQGATPRPVLGAVVRLGPHPDDVPMEDSEGSSSVQMEETEKKPDMIPEAHALPDDLKALRSSLRAGDIPVLSPVALDSFCRAVRVSSNDVIAALVRGMVDAASLDAKRTSAPPTTTELPPQNDFDLTPLRLMIINREGGVPSYARKGLPHLLVNLSSEFDHIQSTFLPTWSESHPTSLSNLRLSQTCLHYMPRSASAVIVSHRSPQSLIANLVTNKPALSSSIPHALVEGTNKVTQHTPTLIRHGLGMRVLRNTKDIEKDKLTGLLEASFGRKLDSEPFYDRLERCLDFVIVAGDYSGAAIVTKESPDSTSSDTSSSPHSTISYLDKFAVLPSHQGDGTVDFLWVALHDETYGLGLTSALNPNIGGKQGYGTGKDLVWRSRGNNPVNKWYFERATGHLRLGDDPGWVMFWSDAEERLARRESEAGSKTRLPFIDLDERGRLEHWGKVVSAIPSSWKK